MKKIGFIFCLVVWIFCACRPTAVPKPYGYARIAVPDTAYEVFEKKPFRFALSTHAQVIPPSLTDEKDWITISYPNLHVTLHGSYFPVRNNLDLLTNDAVKMVYKHVAQATAIPEQAFSNEQANVYGVLFTLQGNTASPYQFFLTDSVHHFFRGSVYCECRPNADSLSPVYEYVEKDIRRLIESWQWVK